MEISLNPSKSKSSPSKRASHKRLRYTIGLDLGGTKLASALISSDGKIVESHKFPLELDRHPTPRASQRRVLDLMSEACMDLFRRYPEETQNSKLFAGVGLASAGPMNVETGELLHPANFRGWRKVALRDLLQSRLRQRGVKENLSHVSFQNDAIAAALAESWVGGAVGKKSFAVLTVGTGIGTGVIFQGRPCQTSGMGSEFGHSIWNGPGVRGQPEKISHHTVEGVASGTGLLRLAQERGLKVSSVEELVNSGQHLDLFDDMAWALAGLCYNLCMGFHLESILVSGGLIKIRHLFLEKVQTRTRQLIQARNPSFHCPIRIAKAGAFAGVLGAGYLPYLDAPTR